MREALTVTAWLAATEPAAAVKAAVEEPAAARTEAGTVKAALLEERVTVEPPVGAAWERVTVQAALELEGTVAGEHCSPVTVTIGAEIVRAATAEVPLREAVTVAV